MHPEDACENLPYKLGKSNVPIDFIGFIDLSDRSFKQTEHSFDQAVFPHHRTNGLHRESFPFFFMILLLKSYSKRNP